MVCVKEGTTYQVRRHSVQHITNMDFADDLAIPSDTVANAELLLPAREEAAFVGLYCNGSKTEYTIHNAEPPMSTLAENIIKHVPNFQYLSSHIMDSQKYFLI